MQALLFLVLCVMAIGIVLVRRLLRGPLHPGWTISFEILAEILRRSSTHGLTLPVERMRRGIMSARIHPKIRSMIVHEHRTHAGLPTRESSRRGGPGRAAPSCTSTAADTSCARRGRIGI